MEGSLDVSLYVWKGRSKIFLRGADFQKFLKILSTFLGQSNWFSELSLSIKKVGGVRMYGYTYFRGESGARQKKKHFFA